MMPSGLWTQGFVSAVLLGGLSPVRLPGKWDWSLCLEFVLWLGSGRRGLTAHTYRQCRCLSATFPICGHYFKIYVHRSNSAVSQLFHLPRMKVRLSKEREILCGHLSTKAHALQASHIIRCIEKEREMYCLKQWCVTFYFLNYKELNDNTSSNNDITSWKQTF